MKKIPFISPNLPPLNELKNDLEQMYKNGIYTNSGPFERLFELKIVEYLDDDVEAICVSNATTGLMIALKALVTKPGKILLPAFTFAATVEAVIWNGFTPIFVDIYKEDWTMKVDSYVEDELNSGGICAILFCNPFGIGSNVSQWEKLAKKFNIPLIIDSAAGLGSKYHDSKMVGTKGDVEILSLHATKTFGIGEGGLIITKNKILAKKLRRLKNFGFNNYNEAIEIGFNAKMGEIYSIIALNLLKNYSYILSKKRIILNKYLQHSQNIFNFPKTLPIAALQFFPLLLKTKSQRKMIEKKLQENNIMYRRYYYPSLDRHPAFKNIDKVHPLTNTHSISSRMIALPLHTKLTSNDVDKIIYIISKFV